MTSASAVPNTTRLVLDLPSGELSSRLALTNRPSLRSMRTQMALLDMPSYARRMAWFLLWSQRSSSTALMISIVAPK
ncbi:fructose-bisphosphate aldolase, cytoplasmic [Musa troglodytarum]|uniref:Fructose-bisphosphate aldolase, cytoplasmic n=1 Tax=Musa troglodytarum TaxID=320322 RepID=A0A9E7HLE7_9LILI|nr:fructose-bisphosphate aldolase, cytoplasmic [Musa troglodytarum]